MPYLPAAVEQLSNPMYVSLYETYLKERESYTFYYAPADGELSGSGNTV